MRKHLLTTLGLAAMSLLTIPAFAEDGHRELGPHVHGHGTLNIAIEDKRVSLELEVPGMDIVGFEHAPSTQDQKTAVEKAKTRLEKPLGMFSLPAAAGCTVAEAKVAIEAEHGDHHGDDHKHDEKSDDDHDHEAAGGHSQFEASYALDCTNPSELTTITFDYFALFAGAHDLTVNLATSKGQSKYEVSRSKPTLDLGGIM
ncbi:MAG: DUF2796 domain-containing protein [Hyphomicrobium sp.]|nr:DUF2796 domain-containing protein [Hyphomicrobium sp.]